MQMHSSSDMAGEGVFRDPQHLLAWLDEFLDVPQVVAPADGENTADSSISSSVVTSVENVKTEVSGEEVPPVESGLPPEMHHGATSSFHQGQLDVVLPVMPPKRCGTCRRVKTPEEFQGKATCQVCLQRKKQKMRHLKEDGKKVAADIMDATTALAAAQMRNAELKGQNRVLSELCGVAAMADDEFQAAPSQSALEKAEDAPDDDSRGGYGHEDAGVAVATGINTRECSTCRRQQALDAFRGNNLTCETCLHKKKRKAEEAKLQDEHLRNKLKELQHALVEVCTENKMLSQHNCKLRNTQELAKMVGAGERLDPSAGSGSGSSRGCMVGTSELHITGGTVFLLILLCAVRLGLNVALTIVEVQAWMDIFMCAAQMMGAIALGLLLRRTWNELKRLHLCSLTIKKRNMACIVWLDIIASFMDMILTVLIFSIKGRQPHTFESGCYVAFSLRLLRCVTCVATALLCAVVLQYIFDLQQQILAATPVVRVSIDMSQAASTTNDDVVISIKERRRTSWPCLNDIQALYVCPVAIDEAYAIALKEHPIQACGCGLGYKCKLHREEVAELHNAEYPAVAVKWPGLDVVPVLASPLADEAYSQALQEHPPAPCGCGLGYTCPKHRAAHAVVGMPTENGK